MGSRSFPLYSNNGSEMKICVIYIIGIAVSFPHSSVVI